MLFTLSDEFMFLKQVVCNGGVCNGFCDPGNLKALSYEKKGWHFRFVNIGATF